MHHILQIKASLVPLEDLFVFQSGHTLGRWYICLPGAAVRTVVSRRDVCDVETGVSFSRGVTSTILGMFRKKLFGVRNIFEQKSLNLR